MKRIVLVVLLTVIAVPVLLAASLLAWVSISDRTNGTIVSSGEERRYLLHVPPSYNAAKPTALVISLHPAASWPAAERNISGWSALANEHGFLVAYPAGRGVPQVWPMGPRSAEVDVRFVADLIDKLEGMYAIDPARIYVDGISNGGAMAFAVSCRLADRVAAVGAVAAAESLPFAWCGAAAPVPMIAFHGTADRIAPYAGGMSGDPVDPKRFPAIGDWVADWARRNQCASTPVETRVAADVRRIGYGGCAQGADVVLYAVDGGGHTWPGGDDLPAWFVGPTTHQIDATRLLWDFYVRHPRSR